MDPEALQMLADSLRTTMSAASGAKLDAALSDVGWLDMLDEIPDVAIPLVFRLLGETGAHAPVLNDVVLRAGGSAPGGTTPLPFTGGSWVTWERGGVGEGPTSAIDGELPIHPVREGDPLPLAALAAGRQALGWWLVGTSRAMLALARQHALDRVQFGRHIGSFQAIRHRLAETLVAIEGAEATLHTASAEPDELASLLAKAAAGQAATDHRAALPAGARRHRIHRRAPAAPPHQAVVDLGRIARQHARADPGGRSDVAGQRFCAAAGTTLTPARQRLSLKP